MARFSSEIQFTGSLGELSAYKMRGVDHVVIRKKGGPSKNMIKKSPRFKETRENIVEFSGRACAAKWMRRSLIYAKALADYNFTGSINALMKPIQELDMDKYRKRDIVLSKNPSLFDGFSLNRTNLFDGVVRNPVTVTMSRENLSAQVDIPALIPGINFFAPQRYAMFGFTAELGVMPDLFFDEVTDTYKPSNFYYHDIHRKAEHSQWLPVMKGTATPLTLNLKLDSLPPDNAFSLVLSIGIRYGIMESADFIKQARHAGSAKILRVV